MWSSHAPAWDPTVGGAERKASCITYLPAVLRYFGRRGRHASGEEPQQKKEGRILPEKYRGDCRVVIKLWAVSFRMLATKV